MLIVILEEEEEEKEAAAEGGRGGEEGSVRACCVCRPICPPMGCLQPAAPQLN